MNQANIDDIKAGDIVLMEVVSIETPQCDANCRLLTVKVPKTFEYVPTATIECNYQTVLLRIGK
jgi:hypothetical protein